ncbi:MAG: ATP-dependent helicase, partial [Proteobacteria bacterium]|nr:ATP-dependent helicase [Pseudomonadota bacterium]
EDPVARYDFTALAGLSGLSHHDLADRLWAEVWMGLVTNDAMAALRTGIQSDFQVPEARLKGPGAGRRIRRGAFNQWRSATPFSGTWRRLPRLEETPDPIEQQEMNKERARSLLDRYGVLFRELCQREAETLQWRHLFRALRIMELGGEVISGHFFEGISGPQFMTPASLRVFQANRDDQVFFINATDPVSPSGLGLGIHGDRLPRRIATNYLVYQGARLVMTVARRGRDLQIELEPGDEKLAACFEVLHHLCYRAIDPVRQLQIDTINGRDAISSPYRSALESVFNVYSDYRSITLQREL